MKRLAFLPLVALVFLTACGDEATQPLEPDATAALSPGGSGGAHDRATGDVTWTSAPGVEGLRTEFDAHSGAPGDRPDRGTVTSYHPDGGTRIVDVECAYVSGNEAWFGGDIIYADGEYAGQTDDDILYWVQDNDIPGTAGPDMIGSWRDLDCDDLGDWQGGGTVTAGNLNVF